MTKNYIKRNDKIYEVQEHEVTVEDQEFHISQVEAQKAELEADLHVMNIVKRKTKYRYR